MPQFDGFIGGAYEAANPMQDCQRLINWFIDGDRETAAKSPMGFLGVPGLVDLGQSAYSGQVRCLWTLPGNTSAIAVVGSNVLLMTVQTTATSSSRPTFTYSLIGNLLSSSGVVKIRDNGSGNLVVIVDGNSLYTYNKLTGVFAQSSDPAFLGSNVVAEIDGWFIFAQPGTQKFYTSPDYWDGVKAMDGTYYALKDNASDNLVTLIEQNRELWLLGESTTEIWYNAGGQYFPFSRLQGTLQQVGCAAAQSVARYGAGLIWLARSERGNNNVVMTQGYQYQSISTPALSYALNQYPVVSDAIGYTYTEEGHEFYVLILPAADVTWVYDVTLGVWHQRASFDPVAGAFHRQRANCIMNFQNMQIAGDYQTGQIYWQTRTAYTDGNYPLVCVRRAPHIWDKSDRNRIRHNRVQIEFSSGIAPQGTNPQAVLKWSNDGGKTFGNEHFASVGLVGDTKHRVIWRRLGIARDRVYELTFSDPVNRDIVGASIEADPLGA